MSTNTLIVRDATLAVNGAPESRPDIGEHLRTRVQETVAMDATTVAECLDLLQPVAESDGADPEVLLALTILGAAHSETCRRHGISSVASGRRLAARLEQSGDIGSAKAVLGFLLETFPEQKSLERDFAAVLRRQGMIQDLVERYEERAQALLKEGKIHEAIGWLQEVLQLDHARKDVARRIRDLRLKELRSQRWSLRGLLPLTMLLALGAGLAWVITRDQRASEAFKALPHAQPGDEPSMRRRLSALEAFIEANPWWYGSFKAVSERTELRGKLAEQQRNAELRNDQLALELFDKLEAAELARARALMHADSGKYQVAIQDFELALSLAPADWAERPSVERDLEALRTYLEERR
jgi:tetratricopeptide (TPR) repeat protein